MSVERPRNIYVVRHGETEANKRFEIQGWRDVPLSSEGINQAMAVGQYIFAMRFPISFIFSSDLSRAVDTASIIGNTVGGARFKLEDLRERNCGEWEGQTVEMLINKYGNEWSKNPPPDAEDDISLAERVVRGVNAAIKKAESLRGDAVIVTHGGAVKVILEQKGIEVSGAGYSVPNGSVTLLSGPRSGGTLVDFTLLGPAIVPPPVKSLDGGNESVNRGYNGYNQKSYGNA